MFLASEKILFKEDKSLFSSPLIYLQFQFFLPRVSFLSWLSPEYPGPWTIRLQQEYRDFLLALIHWGEGHLGYSVHLPSVLQHKNRGKKPIISADIAELLPNDISKTEIHPPLVPGARDAHEHLPLAWSMAFCGCGWPHVFTPCCGCRHAFW